VSGQRGGFIRNAFHHAAVAAQSVGIEVEQLEAWLVERSRHPFGRNGNAHAGGDALTERPCGGFDAAGPAIFRVARTFAIKLAELLDVVEGY